MYVFIFSTNLHTILQRSMV